MQLDPETIRQLAKLTLENRPKEISCEDWLHRVGEYVEHTRRGDELDERLRSMCAIHLPKEHMRPGNDRW